MSALTKPSVTKVEQTTAATPVANDILRQIQGMISGGGGAGAGATPLQRNAGTAIEQYMNSGAGAIDTAKLFGGEGQIDPASIVGGIGSLKMAPQFDMAKMIKAMEGISGRRTEAAVGDLREQFGIMGNRMGTPIAVGEGNLRATMEGDFQEKLGQMMMALDQSNIARAGVQSQQDLGIAQILANVGRTNAVEVPGLKLAAAGQNNNSFLQAIQTMAGMGGDNMNSMLQLIQLGVLPPEIIAQPNLWGQLLTAGVQGAAGVATGKMMG